MAADEAMGRSIDDLVFRRGLRDEGRQITLEALEATKTVRGWNRVKAAQEVGLPRRTFYRRLKEYGIQ